jgi:tagaturonate reductase
MHSVPTAKKNIGQLPRAFYPVKVLQFGSGNFLRGFVDWMLQKMNGNLNFNAGVSVIQSVSRSETLQSQHGVYTVILKGIREDEFVSEHLKVDVIQRVINPAADFKTFLEEGLNPDLQFIISNTTEAGIEFSPADENVHTLSATFPGKLTQLLFTRFNDNLGNHLIVLPTELIENNGDQLKSMVHRYVQHWSLPSSFVPWLNTHVTFCNTLVDRIVSGFPKRSKEVVYDELGYVDELVVEGEWFHLWVIEGPRWIEEVLPLKKAGFNVIFTNDLRPYRIRKVRILNGAHTGMALVGSALGLQSVREAIEDNALGNFMRRIIYDEIIPQIPGELNELEAYANEVINRFRNPAIDHQLASILLNSFSKFKVRVLPSIIDYLKKNGSVPERLSFILAALLYYFRGTVNEVAIKDSNDIFAIMKEAWMNTDSSEAQVFQLTEKVLRQPLWDVDLGKYPELITATARQLVLMVSHGMLESLKHIENK